MHEHQFVFVCGFSEIYYIIFDVFRTEPRFFRIPNRPTFVKNRSEGFRLPRILLTPSLLPNSEQPSDFCQKPIPNRPKLKNPFRTPLLSRTQTSFSGLLILPLTQTIFE
jgi:hypothetical protein